MNMPIQYNLKLFIFKDENMLRFYDCLSSAAGTEDLKAVTTVEFRFFLDSGISFKASSKFRK